MLAIGQVDEVKETMLVDAGYNSVDSVKASFKTQEGKVQKLSYWDNVYRVYPFGNVYFIPSREGEYFVLKYLPMRPSEFVFVTEFTDEEREMMCPKLNELAADIERELEPLRAEEKNLNSQVYEGISDFEEYRKLTRKIRRGKDLTSAEQQFKEVTVRIEEATERLRYIKKLIEHDNYCAE